MYSKNDIILIESLKQKDPCTYNLIMNLIKGYRHDLMLGCHEIRNYITLLSGRMGLFELKQPEIKNNPSWMSFREDLDGLIKLMNEINKLRYAHQPNLTHVDYPALIQKVISEYPFKISFSDSSHVKIINADIDGIRYVLKSLLDNIVESGHSAKVTLKSYKADNLLYTRISDNLPIIDEEIRSKLFGPFNSNKPNHTGLSLATSKVILIAHNGDLTYSYNRGNIFTISLRI